MFTKKENCDSGVKCRARRATVGRLQHGARPEGLGCPQQPPSGIGNASKLSLSPDLCPSCAGAARRLPPACACVYSSPSRRTPKCGRANPENRILRKTQEVRQTI